MASINSLSNKEINRTNNRPTNQSLPRTTHEVVAKFEFTYPQTTIDKRTATMAAGFQVNS